MAFLPIHHLKNASVLCVNCKESRGIVCNDNQSYRARICRNKERESVYDVVLMDARTTRINGVEASADRIEDLLFNLNREIGNLWKVYAFCRLLPASKEYRAMA